MLIQLISIAGALLVLGAYAAHQAERLDSQSYTYLWMNFVGGTGLFLAALIARQAGLMLVEGAWAVVSLWGLVRLARKRRLSSRLSSQWP